MMSFRDKHIATKTLQVQIDLIGSEYDRVKDALITESNDYHWKLEWELKERLKGLRTLKNDLEKVRPKPPNMWDRIVIYIFDRTFVPRFKVEK